jgi:hypothetical protein
MYQNLQVGLSCEQRGDAPNAFRWFDAMSHEPLENDPPTIGAACYKAALYYRYGYHACATHRGREKKLLQLAIFARVRSAMSHHSKFSPHDEQLIPRAADSGSMRSH